MLRLIPGWKQLCDQSPRRRVKKVRPPRDRRNRRAAFEELECRRLLAGDIDFSVLAGDLRSTLSTLQTSVSTAANLAPSIPVVGAGLGNNPGLTQAVGSKANDLQAGFQAVAHDINNNPSASNSAIAGYVQNELASVATGIVVTPNINANGAWRFQMELHQDLAISSVHPQFDAGLGSFITLSSTGSIDLKVGMDYLLRFTFDPTVSAIALESTDLSTVNPSLPSASLAIQVSATPSADFSINGTLAGLLHLSATNNGTQFTGTYGVNIASSGQVSVSLTATAHVGLIAALDFGTGDLPFNPKITSTFHFDWSVNVATLASGINGTTFGNLSNAGFDDVTLDAGSFFGNYVASMIKNIQHFTKPLEPIVDVLTTEIPGLSDIGIHTSLLTLLDPSGSTDALEALDTIKQLNSLDVGSLGGSGQIDFGSFTIGNELRSTGPSIASSSVAPNVVQQANIAAGDTLDELGQNNSIGGIQFPILTDPLHNVFALLVGQNATLFSFKLPEFSFPFSAEIPVLAIPPFAGLFLDVKLLFTINLSMGYDTQGIKEFVHDADMGTTDASKLASDMLDGFYLDNGTHEEDFNDYPDLTVHNTGINISGTIALAAKAIIIKVEGGISADVDLHLDPTLDDPGTSQVRISKVAEEISNGTLPFTASGSIFVSADIEIVIPTPVEDITLAHVNLAHITLLTFDVNSQIPTKSDGETITINESADDQTVHVQMEQLAPDVFGVAPPDVGDVITGQTSFKGYFFDNPDLSDPKAYIEAIVVSYSDHTETYPVAYYHHVNGQLVGLNLEQKYVEEDLPTPLPSVQVGVFKTVDGDSADPGFTLIHYNLITAVPPTPDPLNPVAVVGKQTISIGDIYGDASGGPANPLGAPVNAVLIGGDDDDTLEYDGHGKAVLIGGDGNNSLRAFNNSAQAVYVFGNTIDPAVFNVNQINFAMSSDIQDQIQSEVQSPSNPPDHTSDTLAGAGSSVFLGGGPWDNFLEGPGTATFVGGAGKNEFRIEAKLTDPSIPFVPGILNDNLHADNTVIIDRNGVQDGAHDSVILRADSGFLHITGNVTDLTLLHHESLAISMAGGTLDVGDLSSLGPVNFLVNRGSTSGPATTAIFDTPATGLANPLNIFEHGPVDPVQNPKLIDLDLFQGDGRLPGANVEMIGFTRFDSLDIKLHGGQVNIGDLDGTGMGLVKIDGSVRPAGSTAVDDISVTAHGENTSLAPDPQNNILEKLEDSSTPYDVEIDDNRSQDITTLNYPTQDLANLNTVDASQMKGTLHANVGGATFKLLQVAQNMTVIVAGTDAMHPAEVTVADSKLSHIQSNISVEGAELTIDNSANTAPHIFTMTTNSYTGWSIPGSSFEPTIFLGNDLSPLVDDLTLLTAAGDRFDIEGTPPHISQLVIDNATTTRNAIYVVAATSDMLINGDFNLYLGQRLNPDGTSVRLKHLSPISNVLIKFNFTTKIDDYANTIFDGDLDAPGEQYSLGGDGTLDIVNHTLGLEAKIAGYREQDHLYVYMPGATIGANLQLTSPGTIYLDGQARLSGTNATASNNISIDDRYGFTQLTPLTQYNSLLDSFNDVYLLGSMPQDALTVNVPTNVLITAGVPTQLDLDQNPDAYATVNSTLYGSTLIGWKSGARPSDSGGFFVFQNVDDDQWSSTFASGAGNGTAPNPFEDQPYGIVMPYADSQLTVIYHIWENINGVRTLVDVPIDGTARFWTVNPNPVAVDNSVQLNASQVRGTFNFNVTGPDYDYIEQLERGMSSAVEETVSYNAPFYIWGSGYDLERVAFGQSNITLTDVNPQLSVSINSQNKVYSYPAGSFTSFPDHDDKVIRSPYAATTLNVGNGTLARIQGNVAVSNMIVNVDDSAGTSANNLILTSTSLGTWTTTGGTTQPVLTIGPLDSRTFTVIAGTVDKVDVEGVPTTAGLTSIQTANNSTTPVDVYLMGRAQASAFQAVGNINLHIGDRLNADGSVTLAGQVSGTWATNSTSVPINYQYTGTNGHGLLVYDAANTSASSPQMAIGPVTGDTTKQQLVFNNTRTIVVYGANTDVSYYEPVFGISNIFNLIDNRLNGAVHYYANASGPFSRVNVQAAFGPVEVDGRGVNTAVEISPASFGVLGLGTSPVGNDLSTTILAPVTVTHATLAIRSDTSSTPAPSQPKNVVIGTSQITGIAGAAIQYSNLVDTVSFDTIPGLLVQMPRFAANLTVAGTLAGVTTGVSAIGQSMLSTQVTGTSGRLALGTFDENGTYLFVDGGQEFNYTTQSLTIGNGSVQNIHGDVLIGGTGHFSTSSGIVVDDRSDTAGRTATFNTSFSVNDGAPTIAGLAPGNISTRQIPGGLTVDSSAGSHWTLQGIDSLGPATMYAGVGTIVDLAGPPGNFSNSAVVPRWTIYGAGTVRLNPGAVPKVSSTQFPIIKADPARPTDVTQLILDHTNVNAVFFDDNSAPSGVNNFLQVLDKSSDGLGRVSLGSSTDLQTEVEYAPTTTQLTVTGDHINTPQFNVLDTVALSTTINPNFNQVNVLGTTAPLDITQPALRFSGDAASVILGNNNSMQALHGDITLDGSNAALPTMPATLSFSADSANHVVTFANPSSGHVDITGLAPAVIHVVGTLIAPSITAGTGNNTLVGANATNSWIINAANGGTLNSNFKFAGFRNLTGGTGSDTFRFTPTGSITGNLDGGPGIDSLTYDNSSTWHTLPYNLAQGIAPLVGGTASNLEIVPIDHGSGSNQTSFINDVVSYSPLSIFGGLGAFTYSATGLPTGLSIDAHTGAITGTIATQLSGDHAVHVSATDGYNSAATDFTWTIQTFSLINPGTVRSHAGDVISQPIQVQGSAAGLTFSATSLPDGLSIDPTTGLISGTLTSQAAQAESYGTIVSATDGGSVQSVSFLWLVPSFALQNPGDQTIPEGAPLHIPLLAYNLSGDSLRYDVGHLSDNFYVDSQGILRGSFQVTGEPESFDVSVTASDNFVTDTVEFTITTELGFNISGNDDRRSSDGTPIDTQINVSSPYGHQLSVAVSGLPQGLTIDDNLHITGTISRSAVSSTPYHVTVAVTNETVGYTYTYDAGFDWTVIHVPTAAELNNGSPAGVPFLITTFDPDSFAALTQFQDVTYGSGATTHTVVYFVNGSNIWQYNGQQTTQVKSIDPNNPTMPTSLYQYAAIPGRGIIFSDDQTGHVWFADESGARVIYSGSLQFTAGINGSIVGNFGFVDAEQYDPSAGTVSNVVLQINFNTGSDPTVSSIFNSSYQIDYSNMMPFGGGLIFHAKAPANQAETLYWYNPASSQLTTLLSSTSIGSFAHFTIGDSGDGTQTLYFIENAFGFALLDTLNSGQLSAQHPSITMNESFNEVDLPTAFADGRLAVMESKPSSNGEVVQLYLSNGSGGNTQPVGQPFLIGSDGSVSQPMVIGNDVYFIYTPFYAFYNQITDSTITAQIWKLDVPTASLTSVANFYGTGPVLYGINSLTVGGGKLFFTMYDPAGNIGLFAFDPATGNAEVLGNPHNNFSNPYGLAYLNGALYFVATSQELTDSGGNPSYQPWELGPAAPANTLPGDFNGDGSVDSADYVVWRASNGSQADYNLWRSNFGRTLASGSGVAISSVVQVASPPASQPAMTAISSGSSASTSSDSLTSASVAQEVKSSAADTSKAAAAGYSLDQYFGKFHPADLLRANRSARFGSPQIFNTDAKLLESLMSDDLEQLSAEEYSFFRDTVETKSLVDGDLEVDGIQQKYLDEAFDALDSPLVAPLAE